MATLTIRNLPEDTKRALKERAARHDRSMEAEVRDILQAAVVASHPDIGGIWLAAAGRVRALGGVELDVPRRETTPPVDFE